MYSGCGGATPDQCATSARAAVKRGFTALKTTHFPQAVRHIETPATIDAVVARIVAILYAVVPGIDRGIETNGQDCKAVIAEGLTRYPDGFCQVGRDRRADMVAAGVDQADHHRFAPHGVQCYPLAAAIQEDVITNRLPHGLLAHCKGCLHDIVGPPFMIMHASNMVLSGGGIGCHDLMRGGIVIMFLDGSDATHEEQTHENQGISNCFFRGAHQRKPHIPY